MQQNRIEVGQVVGTWVYPVKSMHGVQMDDIIVRSICVSGDRRRAFIQKNSKREFPWLTAREYPQLLLYAPYFADPSQPETSEIRVKTPSGQDLSVDSDELLAELAKNSKREIFRLQLTRGAYDGMPVSIMGTQSVRALSEEVGFEVDHRRFRQNVLVETEAAFVENSWVGGILTFGDQEDGAKIVVVKPDPRCMITNLNPDTAKQDPAILTTLVAKHDNLMGIYGSPAQREGKIRVGDRIYLTRI